MTNKQRFKKKKNFKVYLWSKKELNAMIAKKFQKLVKNKKRRKIEKELQYFQEQKIFKNKDQKSVSSVTESVESEDIYLIFQL